MRVLGIDPGTATTGWGVVAITDGQPQAVDYGAILTPAHTPLPARLDAIYSEVESLLACFAPDVAVVEELFFGKNVKTAISVAHARGVVLLAAQRAGVQVVEFKPSQIKQTVTGSGAAGKAQVGQMIALLLRLDRIPKPDDVADALAMAYTQAVIGQTLAQIQEAV